MNVWGDELKFAGTKVYSADGKEFALVLGWKDRQYYGEAGRSSRVAVRWPDGKVTWPCVKGLKFENNRWSICS